MNKRVAIGLAPLACAFALIGASAPSGTDSFDAAVAKQRVALSFDGGIFGGPGAAVIQKAVDGAQYVMIGEDHGIAEIPSFSTALCRTIAPQGFDTVAVETGPSTAKVLSAALASSDPVETVAAYDVQHPFSIAFYDFDEEFAFLRSCRDAMGPSRFALWGLDQELMGSSGALLATTAAAIPAQQSAATAELKQLTAQDAADFAKAMKSGDPSDMSMVNLDQRDLTALSSQLAAAGVDVTALNELTVSGRIYREDMAGQGQSELDRVQLQRDHFIAADRAAFAASGTHPKVLLKMGAYHLFEGTSMLGDRELGNFLVEYAALLGKHALNVMVLGVKGQQLAFAGMGHPYAPVPLDLLHDKRADFGFLRPFFVGLGTTPVLYDLRALRGPFAKSGVQNVNLERVVDGYDLLVVIPVPHASHQVSPRGS
jgi:hypothetical protein